MRFETPGKMVIFTLEWPGDRYDLWPQFDKKKSNPRNQSSYSQMMIRMSNHLQQV